MTRTRAKNIAVIVGLACLLSPALYSQGEHSFDLDVPAARSSFWAIDDVGRANRLEADLEIREFRRDARWRPAFQITLAAADRTIALRIVQQDGDRDTTVSVIVTEQGKMTGQQIIDGWRIDKGQRFQLVMDWSTAGVLAISSLGTDRGRFKLEFVPASLKVSVSTGQLFGHKVVLTTK